MKLKNGIQKHALASTNARSSKNEVGRSQIFFFAGFAGFVMSTLWCNQMLQCLHFGRGLEAASPLGGVELG